MLDAAPNLKVVGRAGIGVDNVEDLLDSIGGPELVEQLGALAAEDLEGRAQLLVSSLPANFVPRCISDCDMARVCRIEADAEGEPGRLGEEVQRHLIELRNRGLGMEERRKIYVDTVNKTAGGR